MSNVTPGLVCGHHHLYSALARGMPAPPKQPTTFLEVLEQVWWRLDVALDEEMIRWSAMLGAVEALQSGTTAIVDHHESPSCIDGSLTVLADACAEVGVRLNTTYGVTDRHGPDGARRGLAENERYLRASGRGMVGVHAAFTCSDETLAAAAGLAGDLGVGVHIHVAEGPDDVAAGARLERPRRTTGCSCTASISTARAGTIAHNPRSNMNNAVGYARPARWGTTSCWALTGLAPTCWRRRGSLTWRCAPTISCNRRTPLVVVEAGYTFFPEARDDRVTWSYDHADSGWHVAFTPGMRALDVTLDTGEQVLRDGLPTRVDVDEVRAKASEQAQRLFARL